MTTLATTLTRPALVPYGERFARLERFNPRTAHVQVVEPITRAVEAVEADKKVIVVPIDAFALLELDRDGLIIARHQYPAAHERRNGIAA
jgi:hypothetical protein